MPGEITTPEWHLETPSGRFAFSWPSWKVPTCSEATRQTAADFMTGRVTMNTQQKHNERTHETVSGCPWLNRTSAAHRAELSLQHRRYKKHQATAARSLKKTHHIHLKVFYIYEFIKFQLCHVAFPLEVNYEERRDVIGRLTINRHDVLFWLPPKRAVKKGERPTIRGEDEEEGRYMKWYSPET